VRLRFFGVAGYELITNDGRHILLDPYLDDNPGCPIPSTALERVDLICVSHATFDHLGDTEMIAKRTGAPVVCGGDVKALLVQHGIPENQIQASIWGIALEVAGIRIQPVECHHWSPQVTPDGRFVSGTPLSFIVYVEPDVRFYHYGDTSLFSDLRLIGELYQPNIGCIGITQPWEVLDRVSGPAKILTGEMSPREGALAAQWLGLDTVLPCHYISTDNDDVREFMTYIDVAQKQGLGGPRQALVLSPGDEITYNPMSSNAERE
jgi:L-ascorbate metabolism protein UlaG (beta-lactamase superfamily)